MIERQPRGGPLVHQGEAGEVIIGPDQQRDAAAVLPIALEPRIGEEALASSSPYVLPIGANSEKSYL
jgi:hypothetical protein